MADLNALIAQGAQFRQPQDPFAQYGKMQQLEQNQQANQLNRMKMQEAQLAAVERNALRQLDPSAPDYESQLFKVNPTLGIAYRKEASAAAASKSAQKLNDVTLAEKKQKIISQASRDLSARPDNEQILTYQRDFNESPLFSDSEKATINARAEQLLSMPVEERRAMLVSQGASAGDLSTAATAKAGQDVTMRGQDLTANTAAAGQNVTMRGQNIAANTARAGQDVTTRGQDLTNTRENENLALRREDQRRNGDPVFQRSLAEAKATGTKMAADKVLRTTQLPKVIDTANMTLSGIDTLIGKRDAEGNLLKGQSPHPGFQSAVGATFAPGLRFIPGTDASDFQARFDQIKGGAFMQAYETLKGGGQITNIEGDKGTAALNRMQLAQSEKEFVAAAREFQGIIKTGVERAKKLANLGTEQGTGGFTYLGKEGDK